MRRVLKGVAIALAVIVFIAVFGAVVMQLWNYLVPELFHGPQIGYWQALGLLVLCRILFGGMRGRGMHGHFGRRRWRERWESLTPEERERLRQRFYERCGHRMGGAGHEPQGPAA
ncbi:MAG TPA: hypothetical protein VKT54_15085 [Steroidobacteraceae bacterium]|nr:hypothetical protein [Steroidobacteraceae bacterium]